MERPTVATALASRLPQSIGLCSTDLSGVCAAIGSATQRLLYAREVGDAGWWGSWLEISFELTRADPVFTAPREVGRVISMDVCTHPVPLHNQFYEYLQWGAGRFPKSASCQANSCRAPRAFDRGVFPTFKDIVGTDKKLRFYLTDPADVGKRVLVQYKDANAIPVRTLDGTIQVDGEFLELVAPFVDITYVASVVTGLQKDITLGRVTIYEVDTITASERLLGFMEPGETVAAYRRYFCDALPASCCNPPDASTVVQVTALCALDFVPVSVPTDYLQIPNVEALTRECQAGRMSDMDLPNAVEMSNEHHRAAIRLLQGQLIAREGRTNPAVSFSPFNGSPFVSIGAG